MTSFVLVVAAIAFLSGGVSAVFIMLVIGIRKGDRRRHMPRNTPLDAFTRTTLGASTWPSNPVVHGDREPWRPNEQSGPATPPPTRRL